jgi:HK97 family phage major capsid protein
MLKQRREAYEAAKVLLEKMKAGDLSVKAELANRVAEVEDLDAKIATQRKTDALVQAVGNLGDPPEWPAAKSANPGHVRDAGAWFINQAKGFITEQKWRSGETFLAPEWKAATDTQVTGGASGALGPLLTEVTHEIVRGYRRPLITGLFGTGTISGQAITYWVEGAQEGAPAAVAENAAKPQIHFVNPTPVTEALTKLAEWISVSDEMNQDLEFLVSEINTRLIYALQLLEETQVLSGSGTAPNLKGLLNRTGIQTEKAADNTDNAQALFRAITKVQIAEGYGPDAVVINPADYQNLRLLRDGNGQYYGGGFFQGQYGAGGVLEQPPLWGLRTVVSPAVAPLTAIVGAFGTAATLYRKGGIQIAATNSHGTDFISNRLTIRAEERIALAVRRPSAFVKVTLSNTAPE